MELFQLDVYPFLLIEDSYGIRKFGDDRISGYTWIELIFVLIQTGMSGNRIEYVCCRGNEGERKPAEGIILYLYQTVIISNHKRPYSRDYESWKVSWYIKSSL